MRQLDEDDPEARRTGPTTCLQGAAPTARSRTPHWSDDWRPRRPADPPQGAVRRGRPHRWHRRPHGRRRQGRHRAARRDAAGAGAVRNRDTVVVVVGDAVPTSRPVTWTFEEPRGGGAGCRAPHRAARLRPCARPGRCVLAVDMPRVGPGTFARLTETLLRAAIRRARRRRPAGRGRRPEPAVVRRVPRRGAGARAPCPARGRVRAAGAPARRRARGVPAPPRGRESRDVDTWADLRELGGTARS